MTSISPRRFPRITLLLLALIFLGPLGFAWNLAKKADTITWATTNNGTIIQPAPSIKTLSLYQGQGTSYSPEALLGHWYLVSLQGETCNDECLERQLLVNNVQVALGKNQPRVRRLILSAFKGKTPPKPTQGAPYSGLQLYIAEKTFLEQLAFHSVHLQSADGIFIIDPLGQIMMYYPSDTPLKGVYKDLKRLLAASTIG